MTTNTQFALSIIPELDITQRPIITLPAEVMATLAEFMTIKVTDEASNLEAGKALIRIRGLGKGLVASKIDHLQPATDYVKYIQGECGKLENVIVSTEKYIVSEQRDYRTAQIEAQRKEQEHQNKLAANRAKRAEEKGVTPQIPEVLAPIVQGPAKSIETDFGAQGWRTDWKAERIPGKAHLIPWEYFMSEAVLEKVDIAINGIARSTKGTVQIPGYRIFSVQTPVTRPT